MVGIKTTNKFGVPIYSTGGAPQKFGILQPKPRYRFRVRFINFGDNRENEFLQLQAVSVSRPSLSHEIVPLHSYNSIGYYAGKHSWSEITVTLRDDITNRVSRIVGEQVQKQLNHFEQTGFAAGINYVFDMYIEILDGGNTKIFEEWFCEGCFLSNVNWGSLDYSDSGPATIELTIRPQNCTLRGEDGVESIFPFVAYNNVVGNRSGLIA